MAGALVVAGDAVLGSSARAAGRAGIQKLKDLLISLGIWEAFQATVDNAPEMLAKMYASMTDSGASPEAIASTKDGGRSVVLIEAARQGVVLTQSAGLSRAEARKYADMLKQFGKDLSLSADAGQVARPSTENQAVADASYMLNMSQVCNRLGLSGPNRFRQLYNIALILNTVQEQDVEKAELHESLFGMIRV